MLKLANKAGKLHLKNKYQQPWIITLPQMRACAPLCYTCVSNAATKRVSTVQTALHDRRSDHIYSRRHGSRAIRSVGL
jgi:hypothetical protein